MLDVKDFGAVGDGQTDDQEAIQAAIDAAAAIPGGTVFLSPSKGGYGIDVTSGTGARLSIPSGVTILGSGYAGRIKRIGTYAFNVVGDPSPRLFQNGDDVNGNSDITLKNVYADGRMSTRLAVSASSGAMSLVLEDAEGLPEDGGDLQIVEGSTHDRISYTSIDGNTLNGVSGLTESFDVGAIVWKVDFSVTTAAEAPAEPTFDVDDASGFPSSGALQISQGGVHDRVDYSGKSGNTFTGVENLVETFTAGAVVAFDFDNVNGSFFVVDASDADGINRRIRVEDCTIVDWGGIAIDIRQTDEFLVRGNLLKDVLGGGIIVRGTNWRGVVEANVVDLNYDDAIAVNSNAASGPAEQITIVGNVVRKIESIYAQGNEPLAIRGGTDISAIGNELVGGSDGGIQLRDHGPMDDEGLSPLTRLLIEDNIVIPNTLNGAGIFFTAAAADAANSDVVIRDNIFADSIRQGVLVSLETASVDGLMITGNIVRDCGSAGFDGISLASGALSNVRVADNEVLGAGKGAIVVASETANLVLTGNLVQEPNVSESADQDAISLANVAFSIVDHNIVVDDSGEDRARYGIALASSCDQITIGANPMIASQFDSGAYSNQAANSTGRQGNSFGDANAGNIQETRNATANRLYIRQVVVAEWATLTGVVFRPGTTVFGNVIAGLYDSGGDLVASSASTAVGTANQDQSVAFSVAYVAEPGVYFCALIFDNSGGTCQFNGPASRAMLVPCTFASPGSFTIPSSITPPTAPGVSSAFPLMSTY